MRSLSSDKPNLAILAQRNTVRGIQHSPEGVPRAVTLSIGAKPSTTKPLGDLAADGWG